MLLGCFPESQASKVLLSSQVPSNSATSPEVPRSSFRNLPSAFHYLYQEGFCLPSCNRKKVPDDNLYKS